MFTRRPRTASVHSFWSAFRSYLLETWASCWLCRIYLLSFFSLLVVVVSELGESRFVANAIQTTTSSSDIRHQRAKSTITSNDGDKIRKGTVFTHIPYPSYMGPLYSSDRPSVGPPPSYRRKQAYRQPNKQQTNNSLSLATIDHLQTFLRTRISPHFCQIQSNLTPITNNPILNPESPTTYK